jgi:thiol:disulfide interchange protein DsbD
MTRTAPVLLAVAALTLAVRAQSDVAFAAAANSSTASLVAEVAAITPGKPLTLALHLQHPSGWHSYYRNSGGIEKSPAIEWQLPAGFTAGPIQWPTPQIKDGFSGKSIVYSGSPVFLVDIAVPANLKIGESVTLSAKASWQICSDRCLDESRDFTLTLPVAATAATPAAQTHDLFSQARRELPRTNSLWSVSAYPVDGKVVLRLSPRVGVSPPTAAPVDFIPDAAFLKPLSDGGHITRDGEDWLLALQRHSIDFLDNPIPQGNAFSGIVVVGAAGTPDAHAILIAETPISPPPPPAVSFLTLLAILGGMFLGGLILNLMPCVFPVIGLKIMGFVQQAGDDRKKIVRHGIVFTLGVLVSFGVLSGILFAGRAATGIGWGYQLQYPEVVLGLMVLMFVLALNLFGLFEIGTAATSAGGALQAKRGLAGSFFSGVLATVVSTPCSGPFLGVAIGAAITLPALPFFAAFAAMAIGLALPYLILSAYPDLIRLLPRPGAWMDSFKQAMSFLLFASAGYLLAVYVTQIGVDNMLGPVFGLSTIALAAWIYGRWFLPHKARATRRIALVLTLVLAGSGLLLALPPKPSALQWEPWSQARVDQLLVEGRPVYIDFTASWCPLCQFNKKRAYTPDVIALMKAKNIAALKADKTHPNPEIEAKLLELGRTAIPVNVLLVPGKSAIITPEVLSAAYLTDLFTRQATIGPATSGSSTR